MRIDRLPSSVRRRGLSIAELMISLAISAMLLAAVAAAFAVSTSAINMNDDFFRASQAARVSVNQIMTEVRRCQSGVVDPQSLELTLNTGQKRTYAFDPVAQELRMTIHTGILPEPVYRLASDVSSLRFDTDGTTVSMTMTVKVGDNSVTLSGSALPRRLVTYK
jgi:type II secretory pathway pseudopilin PulG